MYGPNENNSGIYPPPPATASTPTTQPAPQSRHNTGWEYTDGGWRMVPAQEAPKKEEKKPKRRGRWVLAGIALVLVCALSGFGGGYAAITLFGGDAQAPTVVYKSNDGSGGNTGLSNSGNLNVSNVAESAGQSVVSITTENVQSDYFFGDRIVSGAGSGVIISEDGTIITNNHVVEDANNIVVTLPDGSEYPATVVGRDAQTDVAVIKINAAGLTPATIGSSANLRVGDFCIAIGNPLGTLGGTVTDGIISALDREITIDGNAMNLLQMSAAVSPGNSGGGLFNAQGELIGIVNAKNTDDYSEGLGFAIPIDTAMTVAEDLINNGYVTGRPGLGVNVLTVTSPTQLAQFGITLEEPGLYITVVNAGSAAEQAGLQAWDRIVSADGAEVASSEDLQRAMMDKGVGDTLELVIDRGGQQMNVMVTLGELQITN